MWLRSDRLSAVQRVCLELHYAWGYTMEEAAERLGLTAGRPRAHRLDAIQRSRSAESERAVRSQSRGDGDRDEGTRLQARGIPRRRHLCAITCARKRAHPGMARLAAGAAWTGGGACPEQPIAGRFARCSAPRQWAITTLSPEPWRKTTRRSRVTSFHCSADPSGHCTTTVSGCSSRARPKCIRMSFALK